MDARNPCRRARLSKFSLTYTKTRKRYKSDAEELIEQEAKLVVLDFLIYPNSHQLTDCNFSSIEDGYSSEEDEEKKREKLNSESLDSGTYSGASNASCDVTIDGHILTSDLNKDETLSTPYIKLSRQQNFEEYDDASSLDSSQDSDSDNTPRRRKNSALNKSFRSFDKIFERQFSGRRLSDCEKIIEDENDRKSSEDEQMTWSPGDSGRRRRATVFAMSDRAHHLSATRRRSKSLVTNDHLQRIVKQLYAMKRPIKRWISENASEERRKVAYTGTSNTLRLIIPPRGIRNNRPVDSDDSDDALSPKSAAVERLEEISIELMRDHKSLILSHVNDLVSSLKGRGLFSYKMFTVFTRRVASLAPELEEDDAVVWGAASLILNVVKTTIFTKELDDKELELLVDYSAKYVTENARTQLQNEIQQNPSDQPDDENVRSSKFSTWSSLGVVVLGLGLGISYYSSCLHH